MARTPIILCFTTLVALGFILDAASSTVVTKHEMKGPEAVKDVQQYASNEVFEFLKTLEKKCPATNAFKAVFEKFRQYLKLVCWVSAAGENRQKLRNGMMRSQSDELYDAMLALQEKRSGQMRTTMKKNIVDVLKAISVLQQTLSKIAMKKTGLGLTSQEQQEVRQVIMKLERRFAHFVHTSRKEYSIQVSAKRNGG